MTTYNTGNPVGDKGSPDPRDLYDNAENLDVAVNTLSEEEWTDRLGVERKTWYGIEQEAIAAIQNAGYVGTGTDNAVEDYAAGIEITQYNQIVRDTSGEFWRVSGSETLPYTLTGAGVPEGGALVSVGDAALREDFVAHEESTGDVHGIPVGESAEWQAQAQGRVDAHAAEEGDVHGIPVGERALHTGETPDFPAMPTVAGTPVVESGSNSDGEWTRWADGTQIAGGRIDGSAFGDIDISTGSGYRSETASWYYPAIFSNDNTPIMATGEVSQLNTWVGGTGSPQYSLSLRKYRFSPSTFQGTVQTFAFGYWK